MTYNEAIDKLSEMRDRFDSGFSSSDKTIIELLSLDVLGKPIRISGCADCYRDAYMEVYHKLIKEGTMPTMPNYLLKSGALLHEFGSPDYYVRNIPDEVAEDFLRKDPTKIGQFAVYPEDWEERIAKTTATDSDKPTKEAEDKTKKRTTRKRKKIQIK